MTTPVWLLDVDGVINAVHEGVQPGFLRTTVHVPSGMYYDVRYRPDIAARIADLHNSGLVKVRWLTTWFDDAAHGLAPLLGLPDDLPWLGQEHRLLGSDWKALAAQEYLAEQPDLPVVWTDDDLDYARRQGELDWLPHRPGPTLTLTPNWMTGLTEHDLDRIETFLREHHNGAAA